MINNAMVIMKGLFKYICVIFLIVSAQQAVAQTGTYYTYYKNGASCTIAIEQTGSKISADIFAWWHTPSGRHGVFSGKGLVRNNRCVLKSDDPGMDVELPCQIAVIFQKNCLKVTYNNCEPYNLYKDFSGIYQKITDKVPGDYVVAADKCYFYKSDKNSVRLKTYLIKGNKVTVDIENISNKDWVFINYTNSEGKTTSGYMRWAELKRI